MAINCSSNALLDTLNAKKEALNAKVAELQSAGAGAMADLKAKSDEMKAALLAAVPEVAEIPNFKKELEELRGKTGAALVKAKADFKERWGDALPDVDIDGLMDKVTAAASLVTGAAANLAGAVASNFDFCKDVPNIDAPKVSADGVVEEVKVKAAEPIVAADIPKKVEVVVPTVVAKEKLPSVSPKVVKPVDKLKQAQVAMGLELNKYLQPNKFALYDANKEVFRIFKQALNSVGRDKERAAKKNMTLIEYYNTGKGRKVARILVKKYCIALAEENKLKEYKNACMYLNRVMHQNPDADLSEETEKQINRLNKEIITVRAEGETLIGETLGGHGDLVAGYSELMFWHLDLISELRDYKV